MQYLLPFLFYVLWAVGMWKVFEKAGQPGWAGIIPYYNLFILTTKIAKKEILWFILFLIPCTAIVPHIVISLEVAKKFGKSVGFGVGLIFFPFIFYLILAFGDDKYQG